MRFYLFNYYYNIYIYFTILRSFIRDKTQTFFFTFASFVNSFLNVISIEDRIENSCGGYIKYFSDSQIYAKNAKLWFLFPCSEGS